MREHLLGSDSGKPESFHFARPVRQITRAFEKISGHSEGYKHYAHVDEHGNETDTITPEVQEATKLMRQGVADRWRIWWEQNKERVLSVRRKRGLK